MKIRVEITQVEPEDVPAVLDALFTGRFCGGQFQKDFDYGPHDLIAALEKLQTSLNARYQAERDQREAEARNALIDGDA